jgi:hypothetical protein
MSEAFLLITGIAVVAAVFVGGFYAWEKFFNPPPRDPWF